MGLQDPEGGSNARALRAGGERDCNTGSTWMPCRDRCGHLEAARGIRRRGGERGENVSQFGSQSTACIQHASHSTTSSIACSFATLRQRHLTLLTSPPQRVSHGRTMAGPLASRISCLRRNPKYTVSFMFACGLLSGRAAFPQFQVKVACGWLQRHQSAHGSDQSRAVSGPSHSRP